MLLRNSSKEHFHLELRPAPAWIAILALVLLSALCLLVHAGSLLRLAFPVGSFAVGVFLYWRYPILYLGFTWWIWFLTPWVRRLIDYQSGWVDPSPVLLAPYLVTLITLATFLKHLPKLHHLHGVPFALSLISVVYGLLIGIINSKFGLGSKITFLRDALAGFSLSEFHYTLSSVLVTALMWLTPILFGFYLFANWQYYPELRQNIQRTFYWAVILTGIYGVVQFLIAPGWDRTWLESVIAAGENAFGDPAPLKIRVFSTMHASGPFAIFMLAGLLLLLASRGVSRFFALAIGFLAFLLTLVRSAWGAWVLGLLIYITSLKARLQMRLITFLLIAGLCILPLTTMEPFSEYINARVQTLSNVQEDASYQARSETYSKTLGKAVFEPVGNGFGLPGMDSAIIDLFLSLGWIGTIPYLGGLTLLLIKLLQGDKKRCFDPFAKATRAISLSIVATIGIGNPLTGLVGLLLWGFLGITLAANKYYQQHARDC